MILYALYVDAIFFPCHPTYGVLPYSMILYYLTTGTVGALTMRRSKKLFSLGDAKFGSPNCDAKIFL